MGFYGCLQNNNTVNDEGGGDTKAWNEFQPAYVFNAWLICIYAGH